jgi:hypothetical protein
MRGALEEIQPPSHITLEEEDQPYWRSVVAEFPKVDWTPHCLEIAAKLAKTMADHTRNQDLLRAEGEICVMENGKQYTNPRHAIARDQANMIMSFRRNLQMHARALNGNAKPSEVGKRRGQRLSVQNGAQAANKDLLA